MPPSLLGSSLSFRKRRKRPRVDTNVALLVLAGSLCYFLNDGICFAFGIIYADLRQSFERSAATTAILSGMVDAVPQFSAIFVCPIVESIGCGVSAAVGTVFVVVGYFSSAFATSLAPLYLTIGVVSAVGLELIYVAALAVAAVPESKNRGLAIGLTVCGSGLGSIFFSYSLPALLDRYFWAGTFIVISAFFLHILVAVVIFHYRFDLPQAAARQKASGEADISVLPDLCKDASGEKPLLEKPADDPVIDVCKLPDVKVSTSTSTSTSGSGSSKDDTVASSCLKELKHSLIMLSCRKVWTNNEFLVFFVNEFVFGLTVVLIENLLFDHLLAVGFDQWKAATCQALFSGCAAIGHICWGVIADNCSVMSVYCFAQLGTSFFIILAAMLDNFALAAVAIALAGFFKGANETLYCLVIIETLSVDYFYTGLVLLLTAGAVGEMVGTPMGGYVFDRTSSYQLSFLIAGGILGGFTIVVFIVRRFLAVAEQEERRSSEDACVL